MNSRIITSSSIPRTIKIIEKIVLIFTVVAIILLIYINRGLPNRPQLFPIGFVFFPLCIYAGLSFIFPINSPLWQRRLYICLEICLLLSAIFTGWSLDLIIYVVIAKSCFLLPRKEVIITTILTGISLVCLDAYNNIYHISETIEYWRSQLEQLETIYTPSRIILSKLANNLSIYAAASLFVILMCHVLISEQKIRQKAEYLSQEVEDLATQLERSRIARDIHDSLGHTLTTLDIQLELAQKLRSRNSEQALQILDNAKILSSQSLQEVRRAVQTMRSSQFNLHDSLKQLAQWIQQSQSFQIQLDIDLPKLPLQTSHQLYCLVQEALTNIQKHAQARNVILKGYTINLSPAICLEVIDDGQGFNPNAPTMGFGLWGMKERIKILKGELIINSSSGGGTHIKITVPLV